MITNPWQVAYTTAFNENYGVFLKVMTFAADVGGNFLTVGQTYAGDFAQRGVRFLWGAGSHLQTYAAALRASAQSARLALADFFLPAEPDQLIDCWHSLHLFLNTYK